MTNHEALAGLEFGKDVKIVFDDKKICFGYLSVRHDQMEKDLFGYDGGLRKTMPGYVKPHSQTIDRQGDYAMKKNAERDIFSNEEIFTGWNTRLTGNASGNLWKLLTSTRRE